MHPSSSFALASTSSRFMTMSGRQRPPPVGGAFYWVDFDTVGKYRRKGIGKPWHESSRQTVRRHIGDSWYMRSCLRLVGRIADVQRKLTRNDS